MAIADRPHSGPGKMDAVAHGHAPSLPCRAEAVYSHVLRASSSGGTSTSLARPLLCWGSEKWRTHRLLELKGKGGCMYTGAPH